MLYLIANCKPNCDFKFWGKYYSKDTCKKKCKNVGGNGVGEGAPPQTQKRHFCSNVNNNDGNSYKMCVPCKSHDLHPQGVQYFVDTDNKVKHRACDEYNSYDSNAHCTSCFNK